MDQLTVKCSGLWSAPNPFSETPPGALLVANNVVIDQNGILESRRGLDRLAAFSDSTYRASRYYSFQNTLIAAFGPTADRWAGYVGYYNGSSWVTLSGSYLHPDENLARTRFIQAAGNCYFTTSEGIYKVDAYNSTPILAGVPGALDLTGSVTGTSGFFTENPVATITADTANSSTTLTNLSSTSNISVGQYVSGTDITSGTTVTTITLPVTALVTTGNTQAGDNHITVLADTSGAAIGQVVVCDSVPSGTTVTAVNAASTVLTTTATITAGSTSMSSFGATTGIAAGQLVTMSGVPSGTYVQSFNGTTVVLTQAATASVTGGSVTFATPPSLDISNSCTQTVSGAVVTLESPASITLSDAATADGTDVSLSFSSGSQVAYRVVWGIKDANKNVILGAPSNRCVVINNTGTSCNVDLSITIPANITVSHFYQVYRTAISAGVDIDPGDEPQQVYEGNPTSGEIAAGSLTVSDIVPDDLRDASLYTNASQESIAQANTPPPLAWDIANFRDYTFYANVTSKQRLSLALLGVGGSNGIAAGDTLTIAGVTYTAGSSEDSSTGTFKVYTDSSLSDAQQITNTALSLVKVINNYASNTTIYASYTSGVNDLPGKMSLEERGLGGAAFSATASAHGSAFSPALPTSGTSVESDNSAAPHYIMYSKAGQPEAVPLVNYEPVGSRNYKILRIVPLKESLLIFKEQEGIFQLTGFTAADFVVRQLDSSIRLLAPDSAVVLNNQCWLLSDQGIAIATETGTQIVSRPIEDLILNTYGASLTNAAYLSTGIAYEADRKYILLTISGSSDDNPTQALVFNTFTKAFTKWTIAKTTGFVNLTDGLLYLGDVSSYTNVERKTRSFLDYVDEGIDYTINSYSGTTVYLDSTNEINVGDRLYQSSSVNSLILDVQPSYVTVADTLTWTAGSCTVFRAIDCEVEWAPITAGNPAKLKQFPVLTWLFRNQRFNTASTYFASDVSPALEEVEITGTRSGLWGLFPWGSAPWGGVTQPKPIQTWVPLEKQLAGQLRVRLEHRQGYGNFQLEGFDVQVTGQSEVVGF